jgi:hypothetical protein
MVAAMGQVVDSEHRHMPVSLPSVTRPTRLSWRSTLLAAGFAALARPSLWPVALAAFLIRGGIVALVLPLVILPTPTGLANVLMPFLTTAYLGNITFGFILLVAGLGALAVGTIVVSGLIGTWLDAALIRDAASDEELGTLRRRPVDRPRIAWRGMAARLIAYVPFGIAVTWGISRVVGATYAELVLPEDLSSPIALRVLSRVPEATTAIAIAWILGEVLGGLALRHLVLDGASILGSLRSALGDLVRRPLTTLATTVVTDSALAVVATLGVLGSAVAVDRLRFSLGVGNSTAEIVATLVLFAGVWTAALIAVGALTAFRSVAWTYEIARRGTIGEAESGPTGDWAPNEASGRL